MRKILFVLFILLVLPVSVTAQNRDIKAGIFNFDGYHMMDKDGKLQGYGIDLLRLLSEYSDLNFKFQGYDKSWQEMQKMLRDGEIDILTSARRTPEREKEFLFSQPVGRNYTVLRTFRNNNKIKAGDYSTYDGIKIGELHGSTQNGKFEEFAKNKGFSYTIVSYNQPEDLTRALQNGEVDAIVSSNLRKAGDEKTLNIISVDNFYVIARKDDEKLIDEINYAIEQMDLNEGDWENELFYRYYGPDLSNELIFTDREQQFIDNIRNGDKKIIAIAREDMPPYSYKKNGKLEGILPDFFAEIMKVAGLPFEFRLPSNLDANNPEVIDRTVDVVLDRLSPPVLTQKDGIPGFSTTPYMSTGIARVTRSDFNGEVNSVGLATQDRDIYNSDLINRSNIHYYDSADEALKAVKNGEVDAAYVFPYTIQYFANHDPDHDLTYTMMNDSGATFRMFVPEHTSHELITILNKTMKHLPEGILNQISLDHTSFNVEDMSVTHYLRAHPWIFFIGMIILAAGLCALAFFIVRSHWNRKMLATQEVANKELSAQLSIVEALSRDFINILAINEETGMTKPIKIAGYAPRNLTHTEPKEETYELVLQDYIKNRVHPRDRAYMTKALSLKTITEKLAKRAEYSGSYRILDKGSSYFFQFRFVRLVGGGDSKANVLLGFRNIDSMIKKEREQKSRLADALAQARYSSAAKTAFLNNMSHDIRTPMNAIIGFTVLAVSNLDNPGRVRNYLDKIMTSGNHLLSLINDVLDMSRIESGKVKIEEAETSLPQIIHDLKTITQADIKAKQHEFNVQAINIENETIYCDRLRLNQVLLNILSNAIKYTPSGGSITFSVIQKGAPADNQARFEFIIKDTGIGMSKKFLDHVFEPFEREQTSTVSGIQGTGLGLAITKNIVDMMHGNISVESELNKGSEFRILFTFKVKPFETVQTDSHKNFRTLVIDDQNSISPVVNLLSRHGFLAEGAPNGAEALNIVKEALNTPQPFGLFLINTQLADMSGIELTQKLRQLIEPTVPVIIMANTDWSEMEQEAIKAGATAICQKPVFFSTLDNLLNGASRDSGDSADDFKEIFIGKNILLVEDNEMNQEIAQMILESAGFNVEIAEDGAQAVKKLEDAPAGHYNLVLMDVQMPVMNGYEATKKIRKLTDKDKAGIQIIAMTANAFEEDRQEAMAAGMDGYVPKPIDIKILMETLKNIILTQSLITHPDEQ